MLLIALFAVLGLTILRIGQLISVHLFVGLVLLGPIAAKLGSTGYRFARYYTGDRAYRRKGPPNPIMRALAPILVLTTLAVFGSGIALLFEGPAHRGGLVLIHKASFILWLIVTGLHVLGHIVELPSSLRAAREHDSLTGTPGGGVGRGIVLAGALVAGLVLAIALIPQFASWTAQGSFGPH